VVQKLKNQDLALPGRLALEALLYVRPLDEARASAMRDSDSFLKGQDGDVVHLATHTRRTTVVERRASWGGTDTQPWRTFPPHPSNTRKSAVHSQWAKPHGPGTGRRQSRPRDARTPRRPGSERRLTGENVMETPRLRCHALETHGGPSHRRLWPAPGARRGVSLRRRRGQRDGPLVPHPRAIMQAR